MKVKAVDLNPGRGWRFKCPGCGWSHVLPADTGQHRWTFNGDQERPVFSPSVLIRTVKITPENREAYDALATPAQIQGALEDPRFRWVCHSFVGCNGAAPGQIAFLADSTHELAGQAVELPELA